MREIQIRDWRIRLDVPSQVLSLDLPDDVGEGEPAISPSAGALRRGSFVSASLLAQKAKAFDDGLVAAVELAAQRGAGRFQPKSQLLVKVARRLAGIDGARVGDAAAIVAAACELAGLRVGVPEGLGAQVRSTLADFLNDENRSKPIGFWTWSAELTQVFQQDRMLQSPLHGSVGIEILARAVHGDPLLRSLYEDWMSLVSSLTNPPRELDLRAIFELLDQGGATMPNSGVHILPPSQSPEDALVRKLFARDPVPDGFNLAEELIRRIRSGELWLKPGDASGWYDWIVWSLETLAAPARADEAPRLEYGASYQKHLEELLKGILALARETHVKNLPPLAAGCAPPPDLILTPQLSAEPLATHYLRRARGYQFIRGALERAFGVDALDTMKRVNPDGGDGPSLARELTDMEGIFYGAYGTVMRELGLTPDVSLSTNRTGGQEGDAARYQVWASSWSQDPDLHRDTRMMVPVFYDVARKMTKVWVFLGWTTRPLEIGYKKAPAYDVFDRKGKKVDRTTVGVAFDSTTVPLIYPVTAEVYVKRLLNRDEFRAHCDRHRTRAAILANL